MNILTWWADFVTHHRRLTGLLVLVITLLATWGHLYSPPVATEAELPRAARADQVETSPRQPVADEASEFEEPISADQGSESSHSKSVDRASPRTPRNSVAAVPRRLPADRTEARRGADCYLVIETDDVFQPRTVAALRDLAESLESRPEIASISWVDTVPVLNVFGLREPLLPPADASPERFADARRRALQHPLVRGQLLSDDSRTLLMPVDFDWIFVTSDADCTSRLLESARQAAARWPEVPMRIRLTGNVPLYLAHREAFDRNQARFQVIAYGMVFLLAWILFRRLRTVLVVGAAPALGVYWSLGLLNWLDELSNPLTSVVLPVLLTMVGLTDGVHLMVHIRRARAAGWSAVSAANSAVRQVGLASGLTSLTTAIGFGSLLLAQSEFVQGFGRGCALGVLVTFAAVITLIPLLCSTRIGNQIHLGHENDWVGHGMSRCGGFIDGIIARAGRVSWLGIASLLALAAVAATLRPDDRTRDSQPTGSQAYQALAHCDQALGGIEQLRVVIRWPEVPPGEERSILAAIQDVERLLDSEPLLRYPLSILSILASLPGDETPVERYSFLQLLPESVKETYFQESERRAVVTVRMQDLGIARYEPVFRRVEDQLRRLESRYPGFEMELAGEPVRRGRNLHRIVTDLVTSLGTASIIIFLIITLVYRSLRIGLITIVPNLFPLVATAAMMVWLDHPLEIASVCSFTVCLGIAVDDTIHFLTRYRQELAGGAGNHTAIRRSFENVGAAMVITTIILVTGFGTVMTSDLPAHRYFATMAVSTITAALVGDLIFLPALLAYFGKDSPDRFSGPAGHSTE